MNTGQQVLFYQIKAVAAGGVLLGDVDHFLLRLNIHKSNKRLMRRHCLAACCIFQRETCCETLMVVGLQLRFVWHLKPAVTVTINVCSMEQAKLVPYLILIHLQPLGIRVIV